MWENYFEYFNIVKITQIILCVCRHENHFCLRIFITFLLYGKEIVVTYQDIYFIKYLIILCDVLKALKLAFYFL